MVSEWSVEGWCGNQSRLNLVDLLVLYGSRGTAEGSEGGEKLTVITSCFKHEDLSSSGFFFKFDTHRQMDIQGNISGTWAVTNLNALRHFQQYIYPWEIDFNLFL